MVRRTSTRRKVGYKPSKSMRKVANKAVRKAKRSAFTRNVKAVLSSLAENKQAFISTGDSLTFFNSGINSTGDMLQVIPNITQSTADNGRIGDQIRAKSFNIKGYVRLVSNNSVNTTTLSQVYVRMMVLSLKSKANYTEATSSATPLNSLLKKGGTTTAFTGVLSDIMAPINTDLFTVHQEKKFVLKQDWIVQPATAGLNSTAADISKTVKFFNMKMRCKNKLLKYDSGVSSGLLPSNYGCFLVMGYSFLDGSSADTLSTRVGLQFDSMLSYEDA